MTHIVTRRLSVKRKYTTDVTDQSRISESQLSKVINAISIIILLH